MSRKMACCVLSWLILSQASLVHAESPEAKAIAAVQKLGGRVYHSENLPGKPVTRVELSKSKLTDAGLKQLAAFKSLTYLDVSGTQVTNAGLKDLAAFADLEELNLSGSKVTDAGLNDLASLRK